MKTYVLDASALFAFLKGRPGALKVRELVLEAHRGRARLLMSAVIYGEVYGTFLREFGPQPALAAMYAVRPLPVEMCDATPQRSLQAANIKNTYKLYYVDSFAAALAVEHKATLVTSDEDFRRLGHGFPIIWLKP